MNKLLKGARGVIESATPVAFGGSADDDELVDEQAVTKSLLADEDVCVGVSEPSFD